MKLHVSIQELIFYSIAVVILVIVFFLIKHHYCFKHVQRKRLKPYFPHDNERFCEACLNDVMNPKVTCSCGWKGQYNELEEYSYADDLCSVFLCPDCEKEVNI
jgi:hypothetical protein